MKMTNNEIYTHANALLKEFVNCADVKLPIKINFYLQKNIQILKLLATEIEENRFNIIRQYGTLTEDGTAYSVPPENVETVRKELNDLFSLEQEVNIYKINIDNLPDDVILTMSQMDSIMFMIE